MRALKKNAWRNFVAKAVTVALVCVMLVCFSNWAKAANEADAKVQAQINAAERAANRGPFAVEDGTYEGTAKGYGGPVTVAVTMSNGYIDSIEATSHKKEDAQWWDLAKSLLETIPAKQSLDVDVVSTATYSSCGIINATKAAISSAPEVK